MKDCTLIPRLLLIASVGLAISGLLLFGIYLLAEPKDEIYIILAFSNFVLATLFSLLRRQQKRALIENEQKGNENSHVSL